MSFNDIHGIVYEPELATRGKVTLELKTSSVSTGHTRSESAQTSLQQHEYESVVTMEDSLLAIFDKLWSITKGSLKSTFYTT